MAINSLTSLLLKPIRYRVVIVQRNSGAMSYRTTQDIGCYYELIPDADMNRRPIKIMNKYDAA